MIDWIRSMFGTDAKPAPYVTARKVESLAESDEAFEGEIFEDPSFLGQADPCMADEEDTQPLKAATLRHRLASRR